MPPLPPPLAVPLDSLLSGAHDSSWAEADGVVQQVEIADADIHLVVTVLSGPHKYRVVLPRQSSDRVPLDLIGARVRVRGVCGSVFNEKRQLMGMKLLTPSLDLIDGPVAAGGRPVCTARAGDRAACSSSMRPIRDATGSGSAAP